MNAVVTVKIDNFLAVMQLIIITLRFFNVAGEVTRRRLRKHKPGLQVRTSVAPSFRVRVWFRAILHCLILKMGFSSLLIYS